MTMTKEIYTWFSKTQTFRKGYHRHDRMNKIVVFL
jgi:hypothetical protein